MWTQSQQTSVSLHSERVSAASWTLYSVFPTHWSWISATSNTLLRPLPISQKAPPAKAGILGRTTHSLTSYSILFISIIKNKTKLNTAIPWHHCIYMCICLGTTTTHWCATTGLKFWNKPVFSCSDKELKRLIIELH